MSKIDLDELDRKASAAAEETPGPWRRGAVEWHQVFAQYDNALAPQLGRVLLRMNTHFPNAITAEHIAACDPGTVGGLIDRIRELEAALSESREHIRDPSADRRAREILEKGAVRRG